MDLEDLGHPELGRTFLAAYEEHSGQVPPTSLVHHDIACRARLAVERGWTLLRSDVVRTQSADPAGPMHDDAETTDAVYATLLESVLIAAPGHHAGPEPDRRPGAGRADPSALTCPVDRSPLESRDAHRPPPGR